MPSAPPTWNTRPRSSRRLDDRTPRRAICKDGEPHDHGRHAEHVRDDELVGIDGARDPG
jgi:hypothetical protein